ncbi:MAG: YceI family protein [Bacteroidota bacterium]
MKRTTCLFILFALLSTCLAGQSFDTEHLYPIENSHSFVQFEVTYMGYAKFKGNFSDFYGSIYYNPTAPESTSVTFQVDVESIDTNNDWRDRDLKSGNWFLAETFPHIHFSSTGVRSSGKGLIVTGDLTIKETTKRIEFELPAPVSVVDMRGDDQVIFTGEYTLNRKEYGVMGKNWSQVKEGIVALSDEVTIEFSLLGKQINEGNFSNFLRNPKSPPGAVYAAYKEGGLEVAIGKYESLKADTSFTMNSRTLNMVGYMLAKQGKLAEAQTVFERNLSDFPEDGNAYDSLGELYAKMGKQAKATAHYRKSLALDPTNMNAAEALKHLD